jgi:hypothetical protein
MHCLSPSVQNQRWVKAMDARYSASVIATRRERSSNRQTVEGGWQERLEVNVIFTNPQATAVALRCAASLAQDLGAIIRLRAAIVVPLRLPLEQPPVSVTFAERLLSELVGEVDGDACERTVDLYLCRNWLEALRQVLNRNSLIVIGGRKRWWPTAERRLAKALRANGHRVVVVDCGKRSYRIRKRTSRLVSFPPRVLQGASAAGVQLGSNRERDSKLQTAD